jgi:LPXTG-motif cell wall-anchored protein
VATVDEQTGEVTGVSGGTATITASAGSVKAAKEITVEGRKAVPAASIASAAGTAGLKTQSESLGTVKVHVADTVSRLPGEINSLDNVYRQPFGEILAVTEVPITEGMNMRQAVEAALATKDITVYGDSDYITGIGPVTSQDGQRTVNKLSQFDGGSSSGWMISLNDWFINAAANTFTVRDGDVVDLLYTCNMGADLGADFNHPDTTLKALSCSAGVLNPVFASAVKNYTLTLNEATQIKVVPTAANKLVRVYIKSQDTTYRPTDPISVTDGQVITVECGDNTYSITVHIASGDQEAANAVVSLIAALPPADQITLAHKAQIATVREAYDQLTQTQKALVTNYSVLQAAENKIAQIEAANQQAADAVIAKIAALPPVDQITLTHQSQVQAARQAYDALTADQKPLVTNLDVLEAAEARIAELLNPGVVNYANDFLLSSLDFEMAIGERKEIVVLALPDAGNNNGAYNRTDLQFDVISGEGVATVESENPSGTPKGTLYYIKGLQAGVAEIRISYPGYAGQSTVVAVNVKDPNTSGPALETDIKWTKYDTLYFTGDGFRYTFKATAGDGAAVTATVNGQTYAPDESGNVTVTLRDGYNPIVVRATGSGGTTTKVYNIRAKKLSYTVRNVTRPDSQALYEGDTVEISFSGLVIPVPKISRIYNPANVQVAYNCSLPRYSKVLGAGSQYGIGTANTITLEMTGAGEFTLTGGHIEENWFGSGLYSETPVGDAPPNTGAGQTDHNFSSLPDIRLNVLENPGYQPKTFQTVVEHTEEDIWPGDEVIVRIPDLDTATIAQNHPPAGEEWQTLQIIDSYTLFSTNLPGLSTVRSASATKIEELDNLKAVAFTVPEDAAPGTYTLKGGYVWVKYGPSWWTKTTTYFMTKIPDVTIEVVEPMPGVIRGPVEIPNETLRDRLAQAAGKGENYPFKLTRKDLAGITGSVDLSDCGMTDDDMAVMQYLTGVTEIDLSGNTALTSASVIQARFDWTQPKTLDFSGCTGITEIAGAAFKGCTKLTGIVLPEGVTSIGNEAFRDCSGLTSATLPDTLISIGSRGFGNCTKLESIDLPEGLQSLGEAGFYNCPLLKKVDVPDGVTGLNNLMFAYCTGLEEVTLPGNLQSIGDRCFTSNYKLAKIALPETVKSMGIYCFSFSGLKEIKIPAAMTAIGQNCFASSALALFDARGTRFTAVDPNWALPAGTAVLLGADAQVTPAAAGIRLGAETATLTHSIPGGKNIVWGSTDESVATVENGLVRGVQPGSAIIWAKADDNTYGGYCQLTVTDDGQARLSGLTLSDITLAQELDPARYLYSAEIPGNVRKTNVTATAEAGCTIKVNGQAVGNGQPSPDIPLSLGLNTIRVDVTNADGTVTKNYTISLTMNAVTVGDTYIAIGNPELQERLAVAVGKDSGYTGVLTFNELAGITGTLDLSSANITDADMAAMKYLTGVTAFDFSDNPGITKATVVAETFNWATAKSLDFSGCTGLTTLNSNAFKDCARLTAIRLPETVATLGSNAFSNCSELVSADLPGLTDTGTGAFNLCAKLTAVHMSKVVKIGQDAFNSCSSLTEIQLPEGLQSIGYSAFTSSGIREIVLPDTVTSLGMYCFSYTPLEKITLSSGLAELPYQCFNQCKSLKYISIPQSVTTIGSGCFGGCTSLGILDLRKTAFTSLGDWSVPATTAVLFPGADAALSPRAATIRLGEETLAVSHSIPADKTVLWGTSDPAVATVKNGVVTGRKAGTAVIYAKASDDSYSGIVNVTVADTENARLQSLALSGIALNEAFDSRTVFYTADTGFHVTGTTVTAAAADAGDTVTVNGQAVASGAPSQSIPLTMGQNEIVIKVTTADHSVTKTFIITVTMKRLYEGDGILAVSNPQLREKLAVAAGKGSGYDDVLTFDEMAGITGTLNLSNAVIDDVDMGVMKYLKGVSRLDISGNTAITADTVKAATFDWTTPKSLDFSGCTGIKLLNNEAFRNTANLTGIVLPDTVESLNFGSFRDCTNLAQVNLPEGLKTIGQYCFQNCALTYATLPSTVTSLGTYVFTGCTNLTGADLSSVAPSAVQAADGMFRDCKGIQSIGDVKLPAGITSLPNYFFYGCAGLTEVKLPDSVTTLGSNFFRNCTGLVTADISNIETIGSSAFQGCTALRAVTLSPQLGALGGAFFRDCTSLTFLSVPGSVTSIGSKCFTNVPLAILDLRATNFTSLMSSWGVAASAMVLFPGQNAQLTAPSDRVAIGQSMELTHNIPADKTLTWKSNAPATASVANGAVTGVAEGKAYIAVKASDNSYSGWYAVTVYDPVPKVIERIGDLPDPAALTLDDADQVEAARTAYDGLTDAQKAQVTNLDRLTAAEARITELTADKAAADAVTAKIAALPAQITLTDKAQVEAARTAYDGLTDAQKAQVTNLDRLTAAEAKIAELQHAALIGRVRESMDAAAGYAQSAGYMSDWMAVGYANAGESIPGTYLSGLTAEIEEYFETAVNTSAERVTDHERWVLAVLAAGGNPRNVGGHDLIDRICNFYIESINRDITFQGINGVIFGLIALDSQGYQVPQGARYDREYLIGYILDKQHEDGGWSLSGSGTGDVDVTAMALQALAPYHGRANVLAAVSKGVGWLKQKQRSDGGYVSSWGEVNSESAAQAIIALCANGIDPASADFIKSGSSLLDALLRFQNSDGSFSHVQGGGANNMATEQAYLALAAYDKFVRAGGTYNDGKTSIYVFAVPARDMVPPVISTSLKNETVKKAAYSFTVKAMDDTDGAVPVTVKLNGKIVSGTDGKYQVTLKTGKNTIVISAADSSGNRTEKTYAVTCAVQQVSVTTPPAGPAATPTVPAVTPSPTPAPDKTNTGSGGTDADDADSDAIKALREEINKKLQNVRSGDMVTVEIRDGLTLDAAMLDAMKETEDVTVVFQGEGYTLSFNTSDIGDYGEELDISLGLGFTSGNADRIAELTGSESTLILHFDYSGTLPAPFTVVVRLPEDLKDKEPLYLYFYNEATGEMERIEDANLIVQDGYAQFTITHCSDYVLSDILVGQADAPGKNAETGTVPAAPATGGDVTPIVVLAALLLALGAVAVILYRRKKANR